MLEEEGVEEAEAVTVVGGTELVELADNAVAVNSGVLGAAVAKAPTP